MKATTPDQTVLVGFRLTPEQKHELKKQAYANMQTVSEFLRDKVIQ